MSYLFLFFENANTLFLGNTSSSNPTNADEETSTVQNIRKRRKRSEIAKSRDCENSDKEESDSGENLYFNFDQEDTESDFESFYGENDENDERSATEEKEDEIEGNYSFILLLKIIYNILEHLLEDVTDFEVESEWITRKRNFHVQLYGNACLFVGRSFTFHRESHEWSMKKGKITAVVCKKEDRDKLFFKFYDTEKYRKPPSQETLYKYILCSSFMTNDVKKILIDWEGPKEFTGKALVGRKIQRKFREGYFTGTIIKYDQSKKLYRICYEDEDSEDINEKTVLNCLKAFLN